MKCSTVSIKIPTLILGDLDFEFRDHSPIDKNIKHFNTKLNYEFEYNQENIRNDQIDKLNENKTKLPDLKFENTAENISINSKNLVKYFSNK